MVSQDIGNEGGYGGDEGTVFSLSLDFNFNLVSFMTWI